MEAFLVALGTLAFPVEAAPVGVRVVVGLLGLVVLAAGARLERHGVRLAVTAAGALLGVAVLHGAEAPERYFQPWAYAGVVALGMAGALWIERLGYRVALLFTGLVVGAVLGVAVRDTFDLDPSPWGVGVTSLAVGAALPWVFEMLPRVFAPAAGAVALAWAVGVPHNLPLLLGAWGLGTTVQLFTGPAHVFLEEPDGAFR